MTFHCAVCRRRDACRWPRLGRDDSLRCPRKLGTAALRQDPQDMGHEGSRTPLDLAPRGSHSVGNAGRWLSGWRERMCEDQSAGHERASQPPDPRLSIGQFARRSLLSPKALRLYDRQGLLTPAEVDPVNGYRRYRESQLAEARLIARLRKLD